MMLFLKPKSLEIVDKLTRKDIARDIWISCPISYEIIYSKELIDNWMDGLKSNYHVPLPARETIHIFDNLNSFSECDSNMTSSTFRGLNDKISDADNLVSARNKSSL
jgi:acetyl-CoA carboxylase beta subunit